MNPLLIRKAVAELVGTYALVTAGCGAIMIDSLSNGALTHVGVSLTFGLIVMVMISAVGHISGAHFNPAVTFAFAVTQHFPWRELPFYWGAQVVGAIGGAVTLVDKGQKSPKFHGSIIRSLCSDSPELKKATLSRTNSFTNGHKMAINFR